MEFNPYDDRFNASMVHDMKGLRQIFIGMFDMSSLDFAGKIKLLKDIAGQTDLEVCQAMHDNGWTFDNERADIA